MDKETVRQTITTCAYWIGRCLEAALQGTHQDLETPPTAPKPTKCPLTRRTLGKPRPSKQADYEITLPPCTRCHIVQLQQGYRVHIDHASPHCNPLAHLAADTPKLTTTIIAALTTLTTLLTGLTPANLAAAIVLPLLTHLAITTTP